MKQREFRMIARRVLALATDPDSSPKETPVTKERYEGKIGSTQGERNERIPAPIATQMLRDSPLPGMNNPSWFIVHSSWFIVRRRFQVPFLCHELWTTNFERLRCCEL
jgi:hypothetical protein